MNVCIGYDAGSGYPCDRPVLQTLLAGCVHEHLGQRQLCDWHIDDLKTGNMLCGTCLDHPVNPHRCPLVAVTAGVVERAR